VRLERSFSFGLTASRLQKRFVPRSSLRECRSVRAQDAFSIVGKYIGARKHLRIYGRRSFLPVKACTTPGCPEYSEGGPCPQCKARQQRRFDTRRGTSHQRGYGKRWQRARKLYLHEHPQCNRCGYAANEVHHTEEHNGPKDGRFWDETKWEALCKQCHSKETLRKQKEGA